MVETRLGLYVCVACLLPTPCSVTPGWQSEVSHDGSIYTTGITNTANQACPPHGRQNLGWRWPPFKTWSDGPCLVSAGSSLSAPTAGPLMARPHSRACPGTLGGMARSPTQPLAPGYNIAAETRHRPSGCGPRTGGHIPHKWTGSGGPAGTGRTAAPPLGRESRPQGHRTGFSQGTN